MEYDEEIAIMARALNDEQIENILPGYKNIYNQIKVHLLEQIHK